MREKQTYRKVDRVVDLLEHFFSSWRFPLFTLSVLFFFTILVIGITLIPVSDSQVGSFAEEFKTWCLGYNPATGQIETIYLVMFLVQPVIISIFVIGFWFKPLSEATQAGLRQTIPFILAGLLLVALIGTSIPLLFSSSTGDEELPFPADQLRTELEPPSFTLTDHRKQRVSLDDLRGDVVLITAVYASCGETCPRILTRAKELFDKIPDRTLPQIHLLALTLDPQKDTPKMLKMSADHYGLTGSTQHLLTGEPDYVNTLLDDLNIPRNRREDGSINHANLFLLIDKKGKVAYRFTLGERQQKWLLKATRLLLSEENTPESLSHQTKSEETK